MKLAERLNAPLAALLVRRQELLERTHRVDQWAASFREAGLPADAAERFEAHTELRVVEREIAKLREQRR